MEVVNLSRKLIKPSCRTPLHLRNIPSSPWDQIAGTFYGGLIVYYNGDGAHRVDERIKKMEESLSNLLRLYYPHAGRYLRDKLLIHCSDEGVEVSVTKVNCNLSQVVNGEIDSSQLIRFVPKVIESDTTPLLLFQLNVFDCGGMAIGIRASHTLTDAWTMNMFMKGWAIACHEGIAKVPRPTYAYDPEMLNQKEIVGDLVKPMPRKKDGVKVASKMFLFGKGAITSLKADATRFFDAPNPPVLTLLGKQYFSRVEVVSALIWKALIRAEQARNGGKLQPSTLIHAVNFREKTRFSVPKNSCGNLFLLALARFRPAAGESRVDYFELLSLIHNSITSIKTVCENAKSGDELFWIVAETKRVAGEEYVKPGSYVFTSWSQMSYYGADFGWGNPIWTSRFDLPVEANGLLDTRDGQGIEAWLNLDDKIMPLFKQDPEIMAFTSSRVARL